MKKVTKTVMFPVELVQAINKIALAQRRSFSNVVVLAAEALVKDQPLSTKIDNSQLK